MMMTIRATRAAAASLLAAGVLFSGSPASAGDHLLFKKHQSYKIVEGYLLTPQAPAAAPSTALAYVPVVLQPAGNAAQSGSGPASASPQSGLASAPAKAEPSGQMFNTLAAAPLPAATAPAPMPFNLSALASLPATAAPAATFQLAAAPVQTVQFAAAPVQTVHLAAAPMQLAAAPVHLAVAPMQFAAAPLVQTTTTLAAVPAAAPAAGLTPVQVLVPKHGLLNCFGH